MYIHPNKKKQFDLDSNQMSDEVKNLCLQWPVMPATMKNSLVVLHLHWSAELKYLSTFFSRIVYFYTDFEKEALVKVWVNLLSFWFSLMYFLIPTTHGQPVIRAFRITA
mgnify:CR=1 FL=1